MTKGLFAAVVGTALVAALGVSALAMYIAPRAMQPQPAMGKQPAFYTGGQQGYYMPPQGAMQPMYGQPVVYAQPMPQYAQQPVVYSQPVRRTAPAVRRAASTTTYEPAPRAEVRQKRSTQKSVLIVAGSAGAGAAIGGLTGGKKGAAIGAISGGVAGLVYDRLTANPK